MSELHGPREMCMRAQDVCVCVCVHLCICVCVCACVHRTLFEALVVLLRGLWLVVVAGRVAQHGEQDGQARLLARLCDVVCKRRLHELRD